MQFVCLRHETGSLWLTTEIPGAVGVVVQQVTARCAQLEQDLRKSKRREEKLTALQFRLKEDARQMGADPRLALLA